MHDESRNSNREEGPESEMDRIEVKEKYGEDGDSRCYYVAESGTLYPADCLSRVEANRAERARLTGEIVTMRRSDGTQKKATLGRSAFGLAGKIIVCPEGTCGGVGLRHPEVEVVEVGDRPIYDSKNGEPNGRHKQVQSRSRKDGTA